MPSFLNQHLGHPTAVVSINLMILNGTSCLFSISSYLDSRSVISLKIKKSHGSIKILTRMKSWEKIKLYKFLNEKNRLKISILISNVRSMKCSAVSVSLDHPRSQWELIHLDWVYIAVWISVGIKVTQCWFRILGAISLSWLTNSPIKHTCIRPHKSLVSYHHEATLIW